MKWTLIRSNSSHNPLLFEILSLILPLFLVLLHFFQIHPLGCDLNLHIVSCSWFEHQILISWPKCSILIFIEIYSRWRPIPYYYTWNLIIIIIINTNIKSVLTICENKLLHSQYEALPRSSFCNVYNLHRLYIVQHFLLFGDYI